jgi:hypothetical protein
LLVPDLAPGFLGHGAESYALGEMWTTDALVARRQAAHVGAYSHLISGGRLAAGG